MAKRTSVETAPGKPSLAKQKSPERELAELIELLQALIRIPTVNPPGGEIKAARYLEQANGHVCRCARRSGMPKRTSVETAPAKPSLAKQKSPERELAELIELLQAISAW